MGKVLVEKLLRSCNDLETIYILVRGKRGKAAKERWEEVTKLPCFDRIKEEYPSALNDKMVVVEGDVREPKLGLSDEDYNTLVEKVHIVFHVAASVRFNDPLPEAIKMNTCGTKNVVDLSLEMKNLLVFLHVSTAYSFCQNTSVLEEETYRCDIDWRKVIDISENVDPVSFDLLCNKFTNSAPNTYVYTKALAEQVIDDHKDRIPAIIFRPSIVVSSWKEPMPGWVDNFNGPIGLIIAGGKGVVRTSLTKPDAIPDYMAVDISIKAMIIAAWKMGVANGSRLGKVDVYNSSSTSAKSVSNKELLDMCQVVHKSCALNDILWIPSYSITGSKTFYRIKAFFLHYMVALLIDTILRVLGKSPMLLKIHIKIHNAMMAVSYFTLREWTFKNAQFRALNDHVLPEDKEDFDFNFDDLDVLEFFKTATMAGKLYLLHEDLSLHPQAIKKAERMEMVDTAVKWIFRLTIAYFSINYLLKFF